jgi:glycerol-1-phosphate dehydrogenase [NAD(P)+]
MTEAFDLAALKRRLDMAPDSAGLAPIGLKSVLLGEGALESLPDAVAALVAGGARSGPVAILSDLTPKRYRSGELLEFVTKSVASIAGVRSVFVGSEGHNVHADETTVAKATQNCEGASCLVAVGSGTVADIGKVVAAAHGLGYVIVQTADSVNGFADDRSVLLLNGVKRTMPSTWADVLVADVDVLVDAPVAMNAAGLADLIAMFTAPSDWYLANLLGMDDSYSPTVVSLAREQGPALLEAAPLVPTADRAALGQIAATLTLSGVSMGIAGTTAPCSGMEHVASHLLEMAAVSSGGQAALHGAQVGVSSIVAALLWQRVLDELADGGLSRVIVPDAVESEPPSAKSTRAGRWPRSVGETTGASSPGGPGQANVSRWRLSNGRRIPTLLVTFSPRPSPSPRRCEARVPPLASASSTHPSTRTRRVGQ